MNEVQVVKRNWEGKETWRYTGTILEQTSGGVCLEAFFNRPDLPFHGMILGQGDRFVETFFTRRWYNVFAIHDRESNQLKGWYCNVTRPAEIRAGEVSYIDLGLDLLVYPDSHYLELDWDEFEAMQLDEDTRFQAIQALEELKKQSQDQFSRLSLNE